VESRCRYGVFDERLQGCEHGCVYCYARSSHEYWGYSAGLDFERKILVKKNAPLLLEEKLKSKNWRAHTIVLSGNTDCYQPAERQFEITRRCLEIFYKYRHPVGIITKNALVLRDLDLLADLAKDNLVGVNVSITSLNEKIRLLLEPRTATIAKRLQTVRTLSQNGIPVNVMLAPIIPASTAMILPLAKAAADAGALSIAYTVVRLNGAIGQIFTDWIRKAMPDRAERVLRKLPNAWRTIKRQPFWRPYARRWRARTNDPVAGLLARKEVSRARNSNARPFSIASTRRQLNLFG
jgi:DNA repair photolyase